MKKKDLYIIIQLVLGLFLTFGILVVLIPSEIERIANEDIEYFFTIVDIIKGSTVAIVSAVLIVFLEQIKNKNN